MVTVGGARSGTRRNAAVVVGTAAVVAVLFLDPTSTHSSRAQSRPGQPAPAGIAATRTPGSGPATAPTASATAPAVPATPVTVNGTAVDTPYGPVQVQLTVQAGRIRTATAIAYPDGSGRDRAINSSAIPRLQAETVSAQSARIDAVSGATYTSDGYLKSLQSALDAAHLP